MSLITLRASASMSPVVIGNLKVLTPALQARWGLDLEQALRHAATARDLPDMSAIWPEVFRRPEPDGPVDPEHDLYGGFVGNADRRRLTQLRALDPVALARARTGFDDPRLAELLLRWRARNHPDTLTPDEAAQWQQHREAVLLAGEGGARTLAQLQERLDTLAEIHPWLRSRRLLWLWPLLLILLGIGGLLAFAAANPAASPFIYLLF